jgi:hypothetical protein
MVFKDPGHLFGSLNFNFNFPTHQYLVLLPGFQNGRDIKAS